MSTLVKGMLASLSSLPLFTENDLQNFCERFLDGLEMLSNPIDKDIFSAGAVGFLSGNLLAARRLITSLQLRFYN